MTPPAPFNKTGRGIPDVAGNASYNSGYSGIILGGVPTIGNGTSASTPLLVGLIALLNSNLGYNVGFINPIIYQWGPSLFSPINPLWPDPAFPQLAGCPVDNSNNGIPGYKAGPGWDACTGLGSPNGAALLEAFQAPGQAFIYGGYQSPDIILTDLTTMMPVPLSGAPSGPWDTLLEPNVPYGFSAQVHNSSSTEPAYIDSVSFWAIPGGVGTAGGTLLDTVPVATAIPPGGFITVASTKPFVNPGSHMCAVVSIYSTSAAFLFNGAADPNSQDIPNPGSSGSHSSSAWRNTDSMTVGSGGSYKFNLGFEKLPFKLSEPVMLHIESLHIPFDWNRNPKIKQMQAMLDTTGARSNIPLFLLPEFIHRYHSLHLPFQLRSATAMHRRHGGA